MKESRRFSTWEIDRYVVSYDTEFDISSTYSTHEEVTDNPREFIRLVEEGGDHLSVNPDMEDMTYSLNSIEVRDSDTTVEICNLQLRPEFTKEED